MNKHTTQRHTYTVLCSTDQFQFTVDPPPTCSEWSAYADLIGGIMDRERRRRKKMASDAVGRWPGRAQQSRARTKQAEGRRAGSSTTRLISPPPPPPPPRTEEERRKENRTAAIFLCRRTNFNFDYSDYSSASSGDAIQVLG